MAGIHLAGALVVSAFALVVLPRLIFPLRRLPGTALDRTVAGAVLFAALTDAAMYALGLLRAVETLPLIGVWFAAWWLLTRRGSREPVSERVARWFFAVADRAERVGLAAAARSATPAPATERAVRTRDRRSRPGFDGVPACAALLVVLAVSAWLRLRYAISHTELVPEDSYLALSLTKLVRLGRLMGEGTYPHGLYFLMSVLDRFYPFGTYELTRWIGPLTGVLGVLLVYYAVSRATRSRAAGVASAALLGLFAGHPWLLVIWPRQVGPMPMELAIGVALVSLAAGGRYLESRARADLVVAMAALYVAVTTHALVVPMLALGYASIVAVGLVARSWTPRSLARLVAAGIVAVAAGHMYFPIGVVLGVPLQQAFDLYEPTNPGTFVSRLGPPATPGWELANNRLFQVAIAGALLAVAAGALRRRRGLAMAAWGVTTVAVLLAYDLGFSRLGPLFRTRMSWLAGEMIACGVGLGVGACVVLGTAALRAGDPLTAVRRRGASARVAFEAAGLAAAVACAVLVAPSFPAHARDLQPSGYRQATDVSLALVAGEPRLTYTFVGVSEQLQEVLGHGFFVEAWVFARDVSYGEAADPAYELPVPTDTVYVFAEKEAFIGPQVLPYGPNAEYYRNVDTRSRIMRRTIRWLDAYSATHGDASVVHEDAELRVYRIHRVVDVERAHRSPAFKDYRWRPGELFADETSVDADRVG